MERMVTRGELFEMRAWMAQTFMTREEVARLEGDLARMMLEVSELRKENVEFLCDFRKFKETMTERFDAVFDRLVRLEEEQTMANAHLARLESDMESVKADLLGVKADIEGIKGEQAGMKADIEAMKADIVDMKADILVLKADINVMKADIIELKAGQAAHQKILIRIEEKLDRLGKAS